MASDSLTAVPPYVAKLASALERAVPGADVSSEHVYGDRHRFVVVSDRFDGVGHPDRQDLVWKVAADALDGPDVLKVSMIIAMSPEEAGE